MKRGTRLGDLPAQEGTLSEIAQRLAALAVTGETPRIVVPTNAQVFVLAQQGEFAEVVKNATVIADGASVTFAIRKLTRRNVRRIAGVDLTVALCERASELGLKVFLLGGRPGSASDSKRILQERYPQLQVETNCPPLGFENDPVQLEQALKAVRDFEPNIVFVAFGAPKQELFMDRYLRPMMIPLSVAVGGTFEMISGRVKRAPGWMQTVGLEWVFRMAHEPRRLFGRYAKTNTAFLYLFSMELIGRKESGKHRRATAAKRA